MAILHTPRTIAAIARGMLKRRRKLASASTTTLSDPAAQLVGIDADNPHVYKSRLNVLFDADYLGHMNNASYLTHAEYARWEWMTEIGTLQTMIQNGMNMVATNAVVRFRREISVRERAFEIHSFIHAIDDRHLWLNQTFRNKNNGRIMAQVLLQAVAVQNRKVAPPITLLEAAGVSEDVADSLMWKDGDNASEDNDNNANADDDDDDDDDDDAMSFLQRFKDLDVAFRKEAAADDERLLSSKGGTN